MGPPGDEKRGGGSYCWRRFLRVVTLVGTSPSMVLLRINYDFGFIPHDFAHAVKQKGFFAIETGFISL